MSRKQPTSQNFDGGRAPMRLKIKPRINRPMGGFESSGARRPMKSIGRHESRLYDEHGRKRKSA